MTFRFLHLADLHLDSAYGGGSATVERLRAATLEALERAVDFAIESHVDAVIIAGDAFDDERLGYDSRSVLRREVRRLTEHGVSVVYATGNHDPGMPAGRAANLRLQPASSGTSTPTADSQLGEVHTQLDGAPRALYLRGRNGGPSAHVVLAGHGTARVTDNLARSMRALLDAQPLEATPAGRGLPCIGVLHTQVGSAVGADGHEPYAPCSVADLLACDLDYWALGHVHVRGRVDEAVPAYYPGNLQGRNAREFGPKGGLLVELDVDGLDGEPEFIAFAPVEFFRCSGPLLLDSEPETASDLIAAALDEAAALGQAPVARELVIRFDAYGSNGTDSQWSEDFAVAVREELQASAGTAFGDILEVQIVATAVPISDLPPAPHEQDEDRDALIDAIESAPSALREALRACRELDVEHEGTASLEAALVGRLLSHGQRPKTRA